MKIEDLIRPNLKKLVPYSSARNEFSGSEALFLDANENPYNNGVNRYPDPLQNRLKAELAKVKGVKPEQIIIGNGSDEILDLIFRAFCRPSIDNCIILPPTYGMYRVLSTLNDIECIACPLNPDFSFNIERIIKSVKENTKIIFICSPNNPTGNCISIAELVEILDVFEGIVVLDEAYIDFSDQASAAGLLEKYPTLLIVQTLSKAYGAAGLRIGFGLGNWEIITILNRIKPPYNINSLSQEKALSLLQNEYVYKANLQQLQVDKLKLEQAFLQMQFVQHIFPSEANFFLVRVKDSKVTYNYLKEQGIIVRERSHELYCENCLRITIGTTQENEKLIKVMNNFNQINR